MKTKEELNALKEEVEALNKKLMDLNDEELAQVTGGLAHIHVYWKGHQKGDQKKDNNGTQGKAD